MRGFRQGWMIPVCLLAALALAALAEQAGSGTCQHDPGFEDMELKAESAIVITATVRVGDRTVTLKRIGTKDGAVGDLGPLCIADKIEFKVEAEDKDSTVCMTDSIINYLKDTEVSVKVFTGVTDDAQDDYVDTFALDKSGNREKRIWSKTRTMQEWSNSLRGKWVRFEFSGTVEDEPCPIPKHKNSHDGPVDMKGYQARTVFSVLEKIVATQGESVRADSNANRLREQPGYVCAGEVTLDAYSDAAGTEQHFPDGQPVWTAQKMPPAAGGGGGGPPSSPPGKPVRIGAGKRIKPIFSEPGLYRIHAKTCDSERTMFLTVVKVEFHKAEEGPNGNRYGFDNMDTPNNPHDDHISVKRNGATFVEVRIWESPVNVPIHFVSQDPDTARPGIEEKPPPLPPSFLLEIQGRDQRKKETTIEARLGNPDGPVLTSIRVNVYEERVIGLWGIFPVIDKMSQGTHPLNHNLPPEGMLRNTYNNCLKQIVMIIEDMVLHGDKDVRYDLNGNGALDLYLDGGHQDELNPIRAALSLNLDNQLSTLIVKKFNYAWRLAEKAEKGNTTIRIRGNVDNRLDNYTGMQLSLGIGEGEEPVTIKDGNGVNIVLRNALQKIHAAGTPLCLNIAGISGTLDIPMIVQVEQNFEKMMLHEPLHREEIGHLLDVNNTTNLMHYSAIPNRGWELRYKERPLYRGTGAENQWEKIPR